MANPTADDFTEIDQFITARNADEWQTAGGVSYYKDHKFTIRPHAPRGIEQHLQTTGTDFLRQWIDDHSAQRFAEFAATLTSLAGNLRSQGMVALQSERLGSEYEAQQAFGSLTRIARLWEDHTDFKAAWAAD